MIGTLRTLPLLLLASSCASHSQKQTEGSHLRIQGVPRDDHGKTIGCSWYCAAPPITVTASSTLHDGLNSFEAANVHDTRKSTVWAEGAGGNGVGESLVFEFDCTREPFITARQSPLGINGFSLINGFVRSPELWQANGRVKTFRISFNGVAEGVITVLDTAAPQTVKLPNLPLLPGKKNRLILEIADAYPGATCEDTCIADVRFDGYGDHESPTPQ